MDDRTTGVENDDLWVEEEGAKRGAQSSAAGGARRAKTRAASTSAGSTTKNKRGAATDTPLDPDTQRRTRELEAEIAETREDLSETVEAIQEKLRPSNIISESTEAVKTAATQRTRDMADTATDAAYDVMESTRRNPWPALLIGTGVAWLLFDRTRDGETYANRRYGSRRYQSREYPGSKYGVTTPKASRVYGQDRDDWSDEHEYVERSYTDSVNMRSVRDATWRARSGFQRMLHENPLLVAAAAVLTGAAIGGALPQTEQENELMGQARDQVVERAQDAAREAAESVRDVASAVQQVARDVTDVGRH